MPYDIHIERDSPFTLDEWKAAVRETDGIRLSDVGASLTNPKTGDVISFPGSEGDAQINIGGRWLPCFRWSSDGSVACRAIDDFDDEQSQPRILLRQLADKLNAVIRGDDGEEYE